MAFTRTKIRHRPNKRRLPDLPTYYYHTNFCDMLSFVQARYAHVFELSHIEFFEAFAALPQNAQYLYVRMAGCKGHVFDTHKLIYPEIPDIPAALRALGRTGFIAPVTREHYAECLTALTKPDLIALMAKHINASQFKRAWKKDVLIEAALAHMPFEAAQLPPNLIIQTRFEVLRYLSFLHFGKIEDNLQSFTLRDLGLKKTPDFKVDYSARFDSLAEAQSAYFYANALHIFQGGSDDDIAAYIDTAETWPAPQCDISTDARGRLLQKLGSLSERLGDVDTALRLYNHSDAPFCNERIIRLRYKRGETDWCKARLEALIENPGSDDEYNFAEDFYARKFNKKRTSHVTDILRQGESIALDEVFKNTPERAAAHHYTKQGYAVYFTENKLWRSLFGLLFWDELFVSNKATLHNSFDRMPASLIAGQFYVSFKNEIENKLAELSNPSASHIQILKTISRHHDTPNGIFRWHGKMLGLVQTFIESAPPKALAIMLRYMAQDYKSSKDGFPDLMFIKNGTLKFIEVKASGDVIRRNQLTRIKQLREAGFATNITRINWTVDPNQIYVVVDVETTGGKTGAHRVTEIGAVKIQNGHIIDEFQTLLNPQRAILAFITKLTGITNEMVKDAPLFAAIAERFSDFKGGAIFAAHNVNFDYGFISREYEHIGQRFRHPKICTCASMRKHYPGLRSYSLKNLCAEFQIDLDSHHRALCDAKAAAELLLLVNDKRLGADENTLALMK